MKSINVFPSSGPHGRLSNNFGESLWIDKQKWKSVSTYIYANMLQTPTLRDYVKNHDHRGRCNIEDSEAFCEGRDVLLCQSTDGCRWKYPEYSDEGALLKGEFPTGKCLDLCKEKLRDRKGCQETEGCKWSQPKGLRAFSREMSQQETENATREALETAYIAKVEASEVFKKALLKTGKARLIYVSNDTCLGVGKEGRGDNLVGDVLYKLRRTLRRHKDSVEKNEKRKEEEKRTLLAFTAYLSLSEDLNRNYNDLSDYLNMTPLEILCMSKSSIAKNWQNENKDEEVCSDGGSSDGVSSDGSSLDGEERQVRRRSIPLLRSDQEFRKKYGSIFLPPRLPPVVKDYLKESKDGFEGGLAEITRRNKLKQFQDDQIQRRKTLTAIVFFEFLAKKSKKTHDLKDLEVQKTLKAWGETSDRAGGRSLEDLDFMKRAEDMLAQAARKQTALVAKEKDQRKLVKELDSSIREARVRNRPTKPLPILEFKDKKLKGTLTPFKSTNIKETPPSADDIEKWNKKMEEYEKALVAPIEDENYQREVKKLKKIQEDVKKGDMIERVWVMYEKKVLLPEPARSITEELRSLPLPSGDTVIVVAKVTESGDKGSSFPEEEVVGEEREEVVVESGEQGKEENKMCIVCGEKFITLSGKDRCPPPAKCREIEIPHRDKKSNMPSGIPGGKDDQLKAYCKKMWGPNWYKVDKETLKQRYRKAEENSGGEKEHEGGTDLKPHSRPQVVTRPTRMAGRLVSPITDESIFYPCYENKFIVGRRKYPTVEAYVLVRLIAFQLEKGTPFTCESVDDQKVCKKYWKGTITSAFECKQSCEGTVEGLQDLDSSPPSHRSMKQAYDMLLPEGSANFTSLDRLKTEYKKIQQKAEEVRLKANATRAIDNKFRNSVSAQQDLLGTGDAILKWEDHRDLILGINPHTGKGNNFVGKYLMYVRDKLAEENKGRELPKLSLKQLAELLGTDVSFLRPWFGSRLKDIGKTIITMKDYGYELMVRQSKTPDKVEAPFVDEQFVSDLLDYIYEPCGGVMGAIGSDDVPEMPNWFINDIRSLSGFKPRKLTTEKMAIAQLRRPDTGEEVNVDDLLRDYAQEEEIKDFPVSDGAIEVLWQRTVALVRVFVSLGSLQNVRRGIQAVQDWVTDRNQCSPQGMDDNSTNCLVVALGKIMLNIQKFQEKRNWPDQDILLLVRTATAIFLGLKKEQRSSDEYKKNFIPIEPSTDQIRNTLGLLGFKKQDSVEIAPLMSSALQVIRDSSWSLTEKVMKNRRNFFADS